MTIKKFIGTRGIGKTSQLLEYVENNNIDYVICANPRHMMEKAHSLGIQGVTFLHYLDEDEIHMLKVNNEPFVIDEIESFVQAALPTFQAFTCSVD